MRKAIKEIFAYIALMIIMIVIGSWVIGYLLNQSENASCVCGTNEEIVEILKNCSYK